jgi:hypothetical protein
MLLVRSSSGAYISEVFFAKMPATDTVAESMVKVAFLALATLSDTVEICIALAKVTKAIKVTVAQKRR